MHRPLRAGSARTTLVLLAGIAAGYPSSASAQTPPQLDEPNACVDTGGEGDPCIANSGNAGCDGNPFARICVEVDGQSPPAGNCRVPCDTDGEVAHGECSLGESCVTGKLFGGGSTHVCKASRFRMDLNLLDQCIVHFLDGTQPVFSENVCSLERNLNALLDQNNDRSFDIFDLDLCVASFLEQPSCDEDGNCSASDLTFCAEDDDCGNGLHCDTERHVCQRECGLVTSREEDLGVLERPCSGPLKLCDFSRGSCERIDIDTLEELTCEADNECPSGAYCLVGRCAAECFRSLDCPSDDWICTPNNRCRARPGVGNDDEFVFDPRNYAIRFARGQLNIDAVENEDSSQLVIIDLTTKRQVVGNGAVSFGYRMETDYDLKQDLVCLQPFIECDDESVRDPNETQEQCEERQSDCFVSTDEEWIRLVEPFGTVNAAANPDFSIELEDAVAERLTPGVYTATVRLIFDNGDSDSLKVQFTKASPSGHYDGSLSVYLETPDSALNASRPLTFAMQVKVTDVRTDWSTLLRTNNLHSEETLVDTTRGFIVNALLDGSTTFAFSKGDARSRSENKVPLIGLYSPDLRRMRLVGVIDIPADFCIGENGACDPLSETELSVTNPFGRAIRRQIEFVGPFEDAIARFQGLYRERIVGLTPTGDLTFEGGFVMDQQLSDSSPVAIPSPLISNSEAPIFPDDNAALAKVNEEITTWCGTNPEALTTTQIADYLRQAMVDEGRMNDGTVASQIFASNESFDAYLAAAKRDGDTTTNHVFGRTTIFPDVVHFSDLIEGALSALASDNNRADAHLNIFDFLSDRLLLCDQVNPDGSATPSPACVDEAKVRCGIALHQKAVIRGWVNGDQVSPPGTAPPDNGDCPVGEVPAAGGGCECPVPEMVRVRGNCICAEGCECPAGMVKTSNDQCEPDLAGNHDLFCADTFTTTGCAQSGATNPDLFALQEHNRFWRYFGDIQRFSAGKARSDAFLVLFRNAINPFAQGTALSFKADKLREALGHYDALNQSFLNTQSAKVLFRWPARAFKQNGNDWIAIMQAALSERMDAIADAVDLRRRIFGTSGAADFTFAQHLMQYEYLTQAYVMALQKTWQRELFGWEGQSDAIFEQGQQVVNQLNPVKNSLGITADRVFFENSNPARNNWERYRDLLVGEDGSGGLVADTREQVDGAVENLQASLADLDALEDNLDASYEDLVATLNEICGDPAPSVDTQTTGDYCQQLIAEHHDWREWQDIRNCALNNNPNSSCRQEFKFTCSAHQNRVDGNKNSCNEVVQAFIGDTDILNQGGNSLTLGQPVCELSTTGNSINVNGQSRACVGGEMGALLQEKALIDLQRRMVIGSVTTLTRQIEAVVKTANAADARRSRGENERAALIALVVALEAVLAALDSTEDGVKELGDIPNCSFVAGFSFGTSCIGSAISGAIKAAFGTIKAIMAAALTGVKVGFEQSIDRLQRNEDRDVDLIGSDGEVLGMIRDVDGLVDEYQVLSQEAFNVGVQIEHQRFMAEEAAALYQRDVASISERLVGRETGNLLLGNDLTRAASATFREAVKVGHQAAVAFAHHFNVSPAEASQLQNAIASAVTIDDVEDFVALLDRRAQEYCGREGIDCDTGSNVETLRVSLRSLLFPTLRDVAGGPTAGEQFHNSITRPPMIRRRVRGTELVDQIEVPFSLPLDLKESITGGAPVWLIDPLSCNHLLEAASGVDGEQDGTIAVNFVGRNLDREGESLRYGLVRGSTDFVRACAPEPVVREVGTLPVLEFPKRTYVIGYAPAHSTSSQDNPPSFVTTAQALGACINADETNGTLSGANCWRYFARDRSLSSMDWRLDIPLAVGEGDTRNAWVLGEGEDDDTRPIIEDIILYFRYRSRPIQEL